MTNDVIGKPLDRVDGKLKVTGQARYAAEFPAEKMSYAVVVGSAIASGKMRSINIKDAEQAPGVLVVITHENRPKSFAPPQSRSGGASSSASSATGGGAAPPKMPLENNIIEFAGQYIAVVVANSLEGAQHAANLIRVAYIEDDPVIEWADKRAQKYEPTSHMGAPLKSARGDAQGVFASSAVKIDQVSRNPRRKSQSSRNSCHHSFMVRRETHRI